MKRNNLIKKGDWFKGITGMKEYEFQKKSYKSISAILTKQVWQLTNIKTGETFCAGKFEQPYILTLKRIAQTKDLKKTFPPIEIMICSRGNKKYVDVSYLQSLPENKGALFQVASNFNGIEGISENDSPNRKNFTTKYIYDNTQGPIASISAGSGAIARVYLANGSICRHALYLNYAAQRYEQLNFLGSKYLSYYFPVKNGYVSLNKYKLPNSRDKEMLMNYAQIGHHQNIQVVYRNYNNTHYEMLHNPSQIIDQVLCSSINLNNKQNHLLDSDYTKCKFLLDIAYQGTYLCAIKNSNKRLFLTLIGGGVFANPIYLICNAILEAHLKYSKMSCLEKVYIVLYDEYNLSKQFCSLLKKEKIPFTIKDYGL